MQIMRAWGQPDDSRAPTIQTPTTLEELRAVRLKGADPYSTMIQIAKGHPLEREVMKRSTVGMSPWILSAWMISVNK